MRVYTVPFLSLPVFALFMAMLHPTITVGDGGEIVSAAFSLGIPHPPGYPLYTTLAKSFSLIVPFGNIAYRVNIMSALFGVFTCMLVYLITQRIVHTSYLPSFFASLSLALSYEFWYRSTVAEVYTLNAFLILLIIYILLAWRDNPPQSPLNLRGEGKGGYDSRLLYLVSFLLGLGIGNHHTMVLVIPGAVAFVLWSIAKSEVRSQKSEVGSTSQPLNFSTSFLRLTSLVSLLTFFFLLGLSVYLYLPIRSFRNPFMDWGDPENLQNFIDVFMRKIYLPERIERNWGLFGEQLKTFDPVSEFTVMGLLFGLVGAWKLWREDKSTGAMLLLTFALTSYGLIVLAGSSKAGSDVYKKFYLPSYAIFSILIGVGAAALLRGRKTIKSWNPLTLAVLFLATTLLGWQFTAHYPRTYNPDNYLAYDYGMNELNSLKGSAVYMSKGETKTFPLWYLRGVERYREDVRLVTAHFLSQRWYLKEAIKLVGPYLHAGAGNYQQMMVEAIYKENAAKGVYVGFIDEEYMPKNLLTYTQGITFFLHTNPADAPDTDVWPIYRLRGVREVGEGMDSSIEEILKDYASSHYNTGIEYYNKGDMDRAMAEFEKSVAINPNDPDSLNNLAVLYLGKGANLKEAEAMSRRAIGLYKREEDKSLASETLKEVLKKLETGSRI